MSAFNINRPTKRTFNRWMDDFAKLSGVRDVSQDGMDDAAIQQAFAKRSQQCAHRLCAGRDG